MNLNACPLPIAEEVFVEFVEEACLAPTVHNTQPARWRRGKDSSFVLCGDRNRMIPAADPAGRDWRLSIGAHFEGLALAVAARGLHAEAQFSSAHVAVEPETAERIHQEVARIVFRSVPASEGSKQHLPIRSRASWRGGFVTSNEEADTDVAAFSKLRDDCVLVTNRTEVAQIAKLGDAAAMHFLRDDEHRLELVAWLRLLKSHPNYFADGLNREAMSLSLLESFGAAIVLGPAFATLDSMGLAAPLLSEHSKTSAASAIVLFHRPKGEDPFEMGRAFYRAWLDMELCGLVGCPISVLADCPETNGQLSTQHHIPQTRELVSVFRVGRPTGKRSISHARLPLDEVIVC